jgi:hypothetical protein
MEQRPSRGISSVALVAALLLMTNCGRESPSGPGLFLITGHVKLTGYLFESGGRPAGTRVVGDVDGIVVELVYGRDVVAETRTVGGVYRFTGLSPGVYSARTSLLGRIVDVTEPLTIAVRDVAARDTLRVASFGDLMPVPNPRSPDMSAYFDVPDTVVVALDIRNLTGGVIRHLHTQDYFPDFTNSVYWDGRDASDHPMPDAICWITFVSAGDFRAHLLFPH